MQTSWRFLVAVLVVANFLCGSAGAEQPITSAPKPSVSDPGTRSDAISDSDDRLALGIDRSNLGDQGSAVETKTLQDIGALHAQWFRDNMTYYAGPGHISSFVEEIRLAKQNHLKFLAIVGASDDDYDAGYRKPNAGDDFKKRCGWPSGSPEISKINLNKFAQRLSTILQAVKDANLEIDAFEISNEADWICFNGDVPDGREPTDADLMKAVRGYAQFLKTSGKIIHDPRYFPKAKIITFGIAHIGASLDNPPHHFSNPARMIALLRNLDGFNYLDNQYYHVDGYGSHIYPDQSHVAQSITDTIQRDVAILGNDKPFWITECGFPDPKYVKGGRAPTPDQIFQEFISTFQTINRQTPIGPIMFYSYKNLVDKSGNLLPLATTVAAYGAAH